VIRSSETRERVVTEIREFAVGMGSRFLGAIESPIRGGRGNVEFLAAFEVST
jgi:predicted rRNA methylase YqxC with S4 and FtsJ domains